MALIKLKPTSPGTRFVVRVSRQHLHKGGPHEPLTVHQNKTGARNHFGRITTRHVRAAVRGRNTASSTSGATRTASPAWSSASNTIRTAPRTSRWCCYADGERRYILAPKGLKPGR